MKLHNTNTNTTDPTHSRHSLTRGISQVCLEEQARPTKKATLNIANETVKNEQARQIVFHCGAIEKELPLVRVETRKALSSFLSKNQIQNPGALSKKQQELCAWTLLEHASRGDHGSGNINSTLVSSYIHPSEKPRFKALAKSLNLDPAKFIA